MRCLGKPIGQFVLEIYDGLVLRYNTRIKFTLCIFMLFWWLIFVVPVYGQTNLQDFIDHLSEIQPENERYQKVLQFERERKDSVNLDYIHILQDAIEYFTHSGEPAAALPLVNTIAKYYIFDEFVDHGKARSILGKLNPYLGQLKFDSLLLDYHVLSGELNVYTNNSKAAIIDFKTIIDLSREQGDTLHTNFGYAHLKLAEIYSSEWNILESDKYFHSAADFFLQQQDTSLYLWSLSGQSTLYSINGLYHRAEEVRGEILKTGRLSNELQIVATAHISAAGEFKDRKIDELQYEHLVKARSLLNFPSEVRDYIKTITFAYFTQYFSDQNKVDSTDYYLNEFKTFYEPEKHGAWIDQYYQLAQACHAKVHHRYTQSINIVEDLIKDAKSKNKLTQLTRLYKLLVDIYDQSGNKSNAFTALKTHNHLKDSLKNIQIRNQFLYYNQLFEAEKKNKQILQQEASILLLYERNKALLWRGLLVILALSGLFFVIILYRSYRFSRQKSILKQIFAQNLIQKQEKERVRISQELHDGISQELILIKIKLDQAQDTETSNLVAESLSQLRQVTHSLYPVVLKNFGLKPAFEDLAMKLEEAAPDMKVNYNIAECNGSLSKDEELHLYRILQEATNNVLKHAKCNQLDVLLKNESHVIVLEVSDNGIGMNMEDNLPARVGIGMNSMEERSKILGGHFELKSVKGKGTRIKITIPKK